MTVESINKRLNDFINSVSGIYDEDVPNYYQRQQENDTEASDCGKPRKKSKKCDKECGGNCKCNCNANGCRHCQN